MPQKNFLSLLDRLNQSYKASVKLRNNLFSHRSLSCVLLKIRFSHSEVHWVCLSLVKR